MAVLNRLIICRSAASLRNFCTESAEAGLRRASSALSSALPVGNSKGKGRGVQWVFLGCPGVGKGTYAARLSSLLGVPHIATGDLVRQELSSRGPFSSQLADIVNQGKLISDEIIIDLLSKRLEDAQAKGEMGFILDGFPRTVRQAEILEGVTDIDLVINLKLREEALIAKCLGRRICSECGGNYNVACIDIKSEDGRPRMYMPPLLPPPQCESKLITRSDDTEEVVKERLRVYNDMVILIVKESTCRRILPKPWKAVGIRSSGGIPESWQKLLHALNLDDHDDKRTAAA
ncbi:UNVERIFIED_CONTAM: putative adenylate kinase, chloroplastic [Sesamum calycinum]|uniref:adenylate kinase n=1 Tax=Sesamum calycinum TaxID=2727403 RepID=A0AAW2LTE7_9LAMI